MTTTTTTKSAELIANATNAALQIKTVAQVSKEAVNAAFIASAIATHTAIKARVSATKLAESNKAAGAGYGSTAAVSYHALAGAVLSLPSDDFEGSAQSVQTLIRKVNNNELSKTVVSKSKTVGQAIESLTAALDDSLDQVKVLKAALKLIQEVELDRINGNALQEGAMDLVNSLVSALINVETEVSEETVVEVISIPANF